MNKAVQKWWQAWQTSRHILQGSKRKPAICFGLRPVCLFEQIWFCVEDTASFTVSFFYSPCMTWHKARTLLPTHLIIKLKELALHIWKRAVLSSKNFNITSPNTHTHTKGKCLIECVIRIRMFYFFLCKSTCPLQTAVSSILMCLTLEHIDCDQRNKAPCI